jgi:hypothetical protein
MGRREVQRDAAVRAYNRARKQFFFPLNFNAQLVCRYVQAQAKTGDAASVPVDDQRLVRLVDQIVLNQPNRCWW